MKYKNLVIVRKPFGRSYEYMGQKVESPWTLKDTSTGKTYASYEDYLEDKPTKKIEKETPIDEEALAKKAKSDKIKAGIAKAKAAKQKKD